MDLVALSNGLHGSVQMDSVALFSWIGWLRHHGILSWEIETSYRELKYHLDLNTLHSKKRMFIEQEIYTKLVPYNFCSRVSNNIKIKEKDRKYEYQLNYVRAFHIIRNYLKEKGGKNPPDIESLIAKEILAIRPNRQNERKVKAKSPVSFNYRYD